MAEARRGYDDATKNLNPDLQKLGLQIEDLEQSLEKLGAPPLPPPSQSAPSVDPVDETKKNNLANNIQINTHLPPRLPSSESPPRHPSETPPPMPSSGPSLSVQVSLLSQPRNGYLPGFVS